MGAKLSPGLAEFQKFFENGKKKIWRNPFGESAWKSKKFF